MIVSRSKFRGFGESKLQWNATGDAVKSLQKRLIALGVPNVSVTGKFDAQTLNAVKYFQAASGISQDGIVGDNTWAKIREAEGLQVGYTEPAKVYKITERDDAAAKEPGILDTLVNIFKPALPLISGQSQAPVYMAAPSTGVPTWAWVAGGVGAAVLLLTVVSVSAGGRRAPA
jgi:peptidoglycan hydrolase-like protein with peptidoglycan-binding domain